MREGLTYAFDFESMNRTIFFGFNTRTSSYFVGSELASSGLPQGKELEILSPYKDQLPPEVFTTEYKLPVYAIRRRMNERICGKWCSSSQKQAGKSRTAG